MKIAVTGTRGFPGVQGGVESHCEKLYAHLAKNGCDITVFTRKPYVNPEIYSYKGIKLIPIDCPRNKFLEAVLHTYKSVLMARKLNPDILHIHAIGPSVFAPLARILGMKVVVTNHGPDYMRKKWKLPAKWFLRFSEWAGMKFANEVIAISENISDDIRRRFRRSVTTIPNGVDIPLPADTDDALKKYDLQKKQYIISVGRLVPEKGFTDLIGAFNKLQEGRQEVKIDDWILVIVGSADHENSYSMDLRESVAKNKKIVLTGFMTGRPLHELYSHAGIFVLPSYYEGLPIVLLEAMSYGLSCIASNIPANRNMDLNKERFFIPGDVNALALKMKEFVDKPITTDEKEKQINMITERYNWDKIAEVTLKVYKKIIR